MNPPSCFLTWRRLPIGLLGFVLFACWCDTKTTHSADPPTKRVRPVALAWVESAKTLVVAGEGTGELIAIDPQSQKVTGRQQVATCLADVVWSSSLHSFLVIDFKQHTLSQWRPAKLESLFPLEQVRKLSVPDYPCRLALTADGKTIAVSSLWSHAVSWVHFPVAPLPSSQSLVVNSVALPFAPRELRWNTHSDPAQLCVAGAFRAQIALLDTKTQQLTSQQPLVGHNIRGLLWSEKSQSWLLAQQQLDEKLPVTKENIGRGSVLTNVLVWVPFDWISAPAKDSRGRKPRKPTLANLDTLGNGAADPSGLVELADGNFAVALSGVNEVALVRPTGSVLSRTPVGIHPTRLLEVVPGLLAVACHLEDRIDFLETESGKHRGSVVLSQPRELSPQEAGERQFYNANLSHDRWYSCHSCHPDGHTNGLKADTQGDGSFGAPKRTLTLLGTRMTDRWAWNASMQNLRDQVLKSLDTTMQSGHYTPQQTSQLVDFLHTLPPPPPRHPLDQLAPAQKSLVERGRQVFQDRGCIQCHVPPLTYSSHDPVEVGLSDELGNKKFSPPSLRGVGQGEGFLHDSRASTLRSVFEEHSHQLSTPLEEADLVALVQFLESL